MFVIFIILPVITGSFAGALTTTLVGKDTIRLLYEYGLAATALYFCIAGWALFECQE